jgi:phage gpG-like protein
MATKFNFDRVKEKIATMEKDLPPLLANDARNYFLNSFKQQGWEGRQWKEVKRRIEGTNEYKYPKKKDLGRRKRPILIGKGSTKLRRAVADSIESDSWPIIRLVVNLIYAARHNYGLDGMPKRTFMTNSKKLREKLLSRIKTESRKIWQA